MLDTAAAPLRAPLPAAFCEKRLRPITPSLLIDALLSALLLAGLCLPASATTLVRCKIDHKIVYSDTDCPTKTSSSRRNAFSGMPTSKPITIRYRRNKASVNTVSKKTAPR